MIGSNMRGDYPIKALEMGHPVFNSGIKENKLVHRLFFCYSFIIFVPIQDI